MNPVPEHDGSTHEDGPTEADVRYLDLDGDGLPDAIEQTQTVPLHVGSDGVADVVRVIDELDTDIDDEGNPGTVRVTEKLAIDFDHDGVAEVTEVISYDSTPDPPAPAAQPRDE